MAWVSVIIEAAIALLKGFFGMKNVREETISETTPDVDAVHGDPDRLQLFSGSGGGKGDDLGSDGEQRQSGG
jgi:hypothetical protein